MNENIKHNQYLSDLHQFCYLAGFNSAYSRVGSNNPRGEPAGKMPKRCEFYIETLRSYDNGYKDGYKDAMKKIFDIDIENK